MPTRVGNTFTRVADQDVHCTSIHTELHLLKNVFTRQTGFYLAIYPKNYARMVGMITPHASEEANHALKAVRE